MSLKIEWSPRARFDFAGILDYIIAKFGSMAARRFNVHTQEILELILQYPFIYPAVDERPEIRRCVLSKQTTLYYRVESEFIELITFWNNRRDPGDLEH